MRTKDPTLGYVVVGRHGFIGRLLGDPTKDPYNRLWRSDGWHSATLFQTKSAARNAIRRTEQRSANSDYPAANLQMEVVPVGPLLIELTPSRRAGKPVQSQGRKSNVATRETKGH